MKRLEFEKRYLNRKLIIEFKNGDVLNGYLYKTDTEDLKNNPNLYFKKKYYFLGDKLKNDIYHIVFKKSYIKRIYYEIYKNGKLYVSDDLINYDRIKYEINKSSFYKKEKEE